MKLLFQKTYGILLLHLEICIAAVQFSVKSQKREITKGAKAANEGSQILLCFEGRTDGFPGVIAIYPNVVKISNFPYFWSTVPPPSQKSGPFQSHKGFCEASILNKATEAS